MSVCPLCQHKLTGEGTGSNWPPLGKLKTQAFLYKLQLLIVLALIAVSLLVDFRLGINGGKHFSLFVMGWGLVTEWLLYDFLRRSVVVPKIITVTMFFVSLLLAFTGWYYGFLTPILYLVIPILVSAAIIANLVFSIIDHSGNALVYLLANILIGVIPYIVLALSHYERMLPWTICLMITIVAFLAIMIFRGRNVLSEIQKRMNF